MENKEWNKNDRQGREKKKIDATNAIVYATIIIIAVTLFFTGLKYIADHAQYYVK
jgi:uncharacterized membrane protein YidH (DUF202 family)